MLAVVGTTQMISARHAIQAAIGGTVLVTAYLLHRYGPRQLAALRVAIARVAEKPAASIALVAALPVLLRLLMLLWVPIPTPVVADEFSHLFASETFAAGRLANPPHPAWRHFETFYVLQQPTRSSMYPPGQALALTAGRLMGHPWFGVCLSFGLMCGAICWMLRAYVPPVWALLGGVVAALHLGILADWMNSYWGGAFCATGGALLFGGLRRLAARPRTGLALAAGIGWLIVFLTRPYEAVILGLALSVVIAGWIWRRRKHATPIKPWGLPIVMGVAVLLAGAAFTLRHNWRVTGDPLRFPYLLHQKTYGVPHPFYWLPPPVMPEFRHADLKGNFLWDRQEYREGRSNPLRVTGEKAYRLWDFYFGMPLSIALGAAAFAANRRDFRLLMGLCLFSFVGSAMYVFLFPHYFAAYTAFFLLLITAGLRVIARWKFRRLPLGALGVVAMISLLGLRNLPPVGLLGGKTQPLSPQALIQRELRAPVERRLSAMGGRHVVFVVYGPRHNLYQQWIYNAANLDDASIIWARPLDPASNRRLLEYFPGRSVWTVEADVFPPRLEPHRP